MFFTDESRSRSTFGMVFTGEETPSLDYMYFNRPANSIEGRSRRHSGSTSLDIIGRPATRMTGHYWTDRDARGELEFAQRIRHVADSYETAAALFDEGRGE